MLAEDVLNQIVAYDTCKIANAIEALKVRLKNEGFTRPGLRCVTGGRPSAIGYAVTSKVRTESPPMKGTRSYYDLTDWWAEMFDKPQPRIAVIEDIDSHPGRGAVVSDVHAAVLSALNCRAVVTNGAVRNVPGLASMGFPAFAVHVSMSHAYVHMVDHEVPVSILDLQVTPGDLLYVDFHGALSIPEVLVPDILRVAEENRVHERRIIDLCRSSNFNFDTLLAAVKGL